MDHFWNHLAQARDSHSGRIEERLDSYLVKLAPNEIEQFANDFAAMKRRANTKPTLEAAIIIGCGESEDGFTDFRSWIVLQGEKEFDDILKNPDYLGSYQLDATPIEDWYSEYDPSTIYESVTTGRELPWFDHGAYPDFSDSIDVDSLPNRYPKLWNRISSVQQKQQSNADLAQQFFKESLLVSIAASDQNVRLTFDSGVEIMIANARKRFESKYGFSVDSQEHPLLNQQVFSINTEYFPDSFFIWLSNRKKISFGLDDGAYEKFTVTFPPTGG